MSSPSEPNPQLIWDTMNAYQRTEALRAGIELDIFTRIGSGLGTVDQLAPACSASPKGVRVLCDYLTIIGFLEKQDGTYKLTPSSAVFLDRNSPACMASSVRFINSPKLQEGFRNLAESVRRGGTTLPSGGTTEADWNEWETFAESMTPLMRGPAEFIAGKAAAVNPCLVLDIAAGHGLFGIAVARKCPEAHIVAQDWTGVLKIASRNAAQAGVGDRHRALPGDAFAVDFGTGYDVVLLTNFLHHFSVTQNQALLKRIHAAMRPGGMLLTFDFVPNPDRISPPASAAFSMMMLGTTPEGDAYTMSELESMFNVTGFTSHELVNVPQSPAQLVTSVRA
jgi:2-polyprenyl-3-methyl-5-hydroxy-6-metoxy-1,4-benzoquinol methylase